MNAIAQKIKADISSRLLISALIVVTIAVASALLTLALSTLMNISAPYDKSFEELNGAHVWLHLDQDRVSANDIERIKSLPGVVASTELQYSVRNRVRIRDTRVWTSLRVMPIEMPTVNRLLIQEGHYLAPRQLEILASKDLNELYDLSVGDTIGITNADGKELELPAIGLAYNPMWDIYRNSQPPYLYLTKETLQELFPDESDWDWSIGLRLADPDSVDEILAQVEAMLRSDALEDYTDWRDVKYSAIFGFQLNLIFLGTFSFFAILATILVVASSIGSTVLSQFRQIGILKAVGFTKNQILAVYLGQYVVLTLIGVPLGLLLGFVVSPLPLKHIATSLSAKVESPLHPVLIISVFSLTLTNIVLASLGSAHRGANANIVKAIAVGAEAPQQKPFWLVTLATRLGLPMVLILGLNDVFARPFRSFLTGLNLTLGVIGIVFGLTLNQTLNTYRSNPALLGIAHDAMVTRSEMSDSKTQRLLRRTPDIEAFYAEYKFDVTTQQGLSFQVKAVEGDLAAFPIIIPQGRLFQPHTYEAIAGQGLLIWLGLNVGDEITLVLEDRESRPVTLRIVGQYLEPNNAGQMLMIDMSSVERWLDQPNPTTYYLKLRPNCNHSQLKEYLEPDTDSDLNLVLVEQAIPDTVIYLQLAILVLSGILIGIALINVFNTSMLAVQEKLRAVGVLKTLGMTPAQVVTMVNTTAGFLGLLATIVGIPLGLAFTGKLLDTMAISRGFGKVSISLNILHISLVIPLIVTVSVMGSVVPGRKAARLSIVNVLRNE
jgi:putative ABC transport system permease protein